VGFRASSDITVAVNALMALGNALHDSPVPLSPHAPEAARRILNLLTHLSVLMRPEPDPTWTGATAAPASAGCKSLSPAPASRSPGEAQHVLRAATCPPGLRIIGKELLPHGPPFMPRQHAYSSSTDCQLDDALGFSDREEATAENVRIHAAM